MSENAETRFEFGKNWSAFLDRFDQDRLQQSTRSLKELLRVETLAAKTFLDIGSGSGLSSLAAVSMGARVTSIDFDPESVQCTSRLRDRSGIPWRIEKGSVLDSEFMSSLGLFDVVYAWGVLHHTGEMDRAIQMAAERVTPGGCLAIAIYNDQGGASRRWHAVKRVYHRMPSFMRPLYVALVAGIHELKFAFARAAAFHNPLPMADWRAKRQDRGMSVWHDWVDWIGGLPFEFASPERVLLPLVDQGFQLKNLRTIRGWGCNEYVLVRPRDTNSR